jgi:hypothetical protein
LIAAGLVEGRGEHLALSAEGLQRYEVAWPPGLGHIERMIELSRTWTSDHYPPPAPKEWSVPPGIMRPSRTLADATGLYPQRMREPPSPHDPDGRVIAAVRAACPSFEPAWAEHLVDWADDPDARGAYVDMGVFAEHLVTLLDRGETSEFPAVFGAMERLFVSGDAGVRYLLAYGLLESVQNVARNRHGRAFEEGFRTWLGPTTTFEWNEVNRVLDA